MAAYHASRPKFSLLYDSTSTRTTAIHARNTAKDAGWTAHGRHEEYYLRALDQHRREREYDQWLEDGPDGE